MEKLLIIRGESHLRNTTESEILASLTQAELGEQRRFIDLNTVEFGAALSSGYWESLAARVQDIASHALAELNGPEPRKLFYFGIEEVPALIALGAFLGDEHPIECRDYDRDKKLFAWPSSAKTVSLEAVNMPTDTIEATGIVVIRVELSAPIKSDDVDDVIAKSGRLADITIRPVDKTPVVKLMQSSADVDHLRIVFRNVLAAIDSKRPNTQVIHLFVAGSVSVCIAIGRELRLRNGRRVQTYRYRTQEQPPMRDAILLTPGAMSAVQNPLSEEDLRVAVQTREIWGQALKELIQHADALRNAATHAENGWPKYLVGALGSQNGIPSLPDIWKLVSGNDSVGTEPHTEFFFDSKTRQWRFADRMMVMMSRAAAGDNGKLRRLARAFFWHEYVHDFQNLTQYTATGVGGFPNCLERVDYVADLYSLLHQADFALRGERTQGDAKVKEILVQGITEAIDSFWTFEDPAPIRWLQQRRLRRYLNWYWRREQLQHEVTLTGAIALLSQPPSIEVSGLPPAVDGRRILVDLSKIERADQLEVGIVSEDNKLVRCPNSPTLSVAEMLNAFAQRDRSKIDDFFGALYDHATR